MGVGSAISKWQLATGQAAFACAPVWGPRTQANLGRGRVRCAQYCFRLSTYGLHHLVTIWQGGVSASRGGGHSSLGGHLAGWPRVRPSDMTCLHTRASHAAPADATPTSWAPQLLLSRGDQVGGWLVQATSAWHTAPLGGNWAGVRLRVTLSSPLYPTSGSKLRGLAALQDVVCMTAARFGASQRAAATTAVGEAVLCAYQ